MTALPAPHPKHKFAKIFMACAASGILLGGVSNFCSHRNDHRKELQENFQANREEFSVYGHNISNTEINGEWISKTVSPLEAKHIAIQQYHQECMNDITDGALFGCIAGAGVFLLIYSCKPLSKEEKEFYSRLTP